MNAHSIFRAAFVVGLQLVEPEDPSQIENELAIGRADVSPLQTLDHRQVQVERPGNR